jgi:hypoxanthine phosphoribosyltransferase
MPEDSSLPHPDLSEVLLSADVVAGRVAELGSELARDYAEKRPIILATLKGSVIFMSDLLRCMTPTPKGLQIEFIRASSYHGTSTVSSGEVTLSSSTVQEKDIAGRHVLVVRDTLSTRSRLALDSLSTRSRLALDSLSTRETRTIGGMRFFQ